jgi:Phosphomannose isomerase
MYPLKLKPVYSKTIWGDGRLAAKRGIDDKIGTSWEISAHSHADNEILNGKYTGFTLNELIDRYPKEILGNKKRSQMLRLAYLDAAESLSIQVHPDDDYAHKYESDEGKTEAWYILEAVPGSTLIAGTTIKDPKVIKEAVNKQEVEQYTRKIEMKSGDFICIEAGMLHALGKGILALEIGQNSDTTYRFYDYNRRDSNGNLRELHLDKCFDVAHFDLECEKISSPIEEINSTRIKALVRRKEFCVDLIDIKDEYELIPNGDTFYCISNVSNNTTYYYEGKEEILSHTENIFVPADCGSIRIKGTCRILVSYIK